MNEKNDTQDHRKFAVLEIVQPANALYYVLFKPMPCEIKAAKMRTKAIKDMEENNIAGVAFDYLDNKKYQKSSTFELTIYTISSFLLLYFASFEKHLSEGERQQLSLLKILPLILPALNSAGVKIWKRSRIPEASIKELLLTSLIIIAATSILPVEHYFTAIVLFFVSCHFLPNLGNLLRHLETKNACEEWLSLKFRNKESLDKLHNLTHYIDGYSISSMNSLSKILEKEGIDPQPAWDALWK